MAHGVIIRELPSQDAVNYRFAKHTADLDNGQVISLDGLADGEHDVWKVADASSGKEIWIVTGVELQYDEKKQISDYVNEAGKPFRCERAEGMIVAISKEVLSFVTNEATDMVAGAWVGATAGNRLLLDAGETTLSDVYGQVIDVYTRGGIKFAAIEFTNSVNNK